MSFCGTPSMPCRKLVSMATLSKALLLFLKSVKRMNIKLKTAWFYGVPCGARPGREARCRALARALYRDAGIVLDRRGEKGAEPEGKAFDLPVEPTLWS